MHIAYQVFGDGDLDLVLVPGYVTHVELIWEHEPAARFMESLAAFARVISFDRRGSGLSDPVAEVPTLEQRMDDVRAVMDDARSEQAALVGLSEGAPLSILFAASHPERTRALVCSGGMARSTYADDYPWATPAQALVESGLELIQPHWGDGSLIEVAAPSQANNPRSREWFARMQRATASPGTSPLGKTSGTPASARRAVKRLACTASSRSTAGTLSESCNARRAVTVP